MPLLILHNFLKMSKLEGNSVSRTHSEIPLNPSSKTWSSIGIKLKSLHNLQKALNHWNSMDQASKVPKNFNPKSFKFKEFLKNLKNNKSLKKIIRSIFQSKKRRFRLRVKITKKIEEDYSFLKGLKTENCTHYSIIQIIFVKHYQFFDFRT